jgi:pimeloyl-ACP methyl ester carboxylesterase
MKTPTLILVHGAGGGAWTWELVVVVLDELGCAHRALDLPSSSASPPHDAGIASDVATVRAVLDELVAPVVLVGVSYGGVVISAAAVDHPAVARLVYVAAFMPEPGIPIRSQLVPSEDFVAAMSAAVARNPSAHGGLDPAIAAEFVFPQAPPDVARQAIARMRPMVLTDADMILPSVAWQTIPSTYIVCTEDRMIPPDYQRRCATERATARIDVPYDHAPTRSHPNELAKLLAEITGEVAEGSEPPCSTQ